MRSWAADLRAIEYSSFRLRRLARRLHFWLGAVAMIYIVFISLSGCAIVFEHELYRFFLPDPAVPGLSDGPLEIEPLKAIVAKRYPQQVVVGIWERRLSAGVVAEVWLDGSNNTRRRLVHPRTGEDLGDAQPFMLRALAFLRRAHISALAGTSGRVMNAIGGGALIVLSLSGVMMRRRKSASCESLQNAVSGRKRHAMAFHRTAGTWAWLFGAMWGITGACFTCPSALNLFGLGYEPVLEGLYQVHTGAAGGAAMRMVWIVVGLSLSFLAITGLVMSWRRIVGNLPGGSALRSVALPPAAQPANV